MKVLPKQQQYTLFTNLRRRLEHCENEIDAVVLISSYASIVGKMSERNLINILRFSGIPTDHPSTDLIRLYIVLDVLNLSDRTALFDSPNHDKEYYEEEYRDDIREVRDKLEEVRNRLMEEF
jgi:hypothetical protein